MVQQQHTEAARLRAWGKRKQRHDVVQRVVEVTEKVVPVEVEVEMTRVVEVLPSMEEVLRRIHWDAANKRVVYKSPDTGRIIEVLRIPEIGVTSVRAGRESSDRMSTIAARMMAMDNSNMKRAIAGNEIAFFKDVRSLAASVRSQDATKGRRIARVRKAEKQPVHVAPGTELLYPETPINTAIKPDETSRESVVNSAKRRGR
jgi:hypothetical protein